MPSLTVTVRLSEQPVAALRVYARRKNMSMTDVINLAIQKLEADDASSNRWQ